MDSQAHLEHPVEFDSSLVLAPELAPPSVPDHPDASAATAAPASRVDPAAAGPATARDETPRPQTALDLTARAGSEMIGHNAAMARRLLVAGAEMTSHMNAYAQANLDLVTRSNAELMGVVWSASNDWSACTRRYVDYIVFERWSAFMRHRTPQHLAVLQAETFRTGVATALDFARIGAATLRGRA